LKSSGNTAVECLEWFWNDTLYSWETMFFINYILITNLMH